MRRLSTPAFVISLLLAACGRIGGNQPASPHLLSSWYENKVNGEIWLVWNGSGQAWLEAKFTPDEDCHLYDKDLPREGMDGLGRPTLIEVIPGGSLISMGEISASIAVIPESDIPGLLVYPPGEVTLSLPVRLPEGHGWYEAELSITYMACKGGRCYPPVEEKVYPVHVPGLEELDD